MKTLTLSAGFTESILKGCVTRMSSSDDTIPLVDLSCSQEDEYEATTNRKRKEKEVLQIVDSPLMKKPRPSDGTPSMSASPNESRNDLASIYQRLNDLEKFITQAPFQSTQMGKYVTREEFEELSKRVTRIEERLGKVEQIFGSIKSAFLGAHPSSKSRATAANSDEKRTKPSPETNETVPLKKATGSASTAILGTHPSSKSRAIASNSTGKQTRPSPETRGSVPLKKATNSASTATSSASGKTAQQPTANATAQLISTPRKSTPKSNGINSVNPQNAHFIPGSSTSGVQTFRAGTEGPLVHTKVVPAKPRSSTDLNVTNNNVRTALKTATNVHKVSPGTSKSKSLSGQSSTTPSPSSASTSTSHPKTSSAPVSVVNVPSTLSITPVSNNRHSMQNSAPVGPNTTPTGRDQQTPNAPRNSDHWRNNLSQILSEPPPYQNDSNVQQGQEELPEGIIGAIRVKQELYDGIPLEKVDTASFRKDYDQSVLIYIEGGGRKIRNQNLYGAVGTLSLSDTWIRAISYLSDLDSARPTKQIRTIQAEAEIIAALFAIEDVKRNSTEPGPFRVTIVTKCEKLKTIMSDPTLYFYNLHICDCTAFPCGHVDRWISLDPFASKYCDDLPRLVLATRLVQVKWRTYTQQEKDRQMQELFRLKINTELRSLITKNLK